jgi:hypothetical protein
MPSFVIPAEYCLALADLSAYPPFVASQWTLPTLLGHFVDQMNTRTLLAWGTGASANWRIDVSLDRTDLTGFREFSGRITVTGTRLHLTSYDELSFAAQFRDCQLPREGTKQWFILLKRGTYDCRVVQLYDPELAESSEVFEQEEPHFAIELTATRSRQANAFDSVPWFNV